MRYFYARVSTQEQTLARQLEAAKSVYGGEYDEVFCDKRSGKDFDRPEYRKMKSVAKRGDEIVIKNLDRLGRNKYGLRDELKEFRDRGIKIRILDIPTTLLEFPDGQEWVFDMVNNILLEVLSSIAEQELETIHKRTREGIDAMPTDEEGYRVSIRTGRRAGRESVEVQGFEDMYSRYKDGEFTASEAASELSISRRKFFTLAKEYKENGLH